MFKKRANLKICVSLFLICVINLFFCDSAFSDMPQQIFFQAKLTKKDGTTLAGSHSLAFRLYTASSGGSALWTETQSLTADASGIVSCYLGGTTSFPSTMDFNSTYYLSIEVDSDGEMSPRIKIVPSLAALNSDRFDGLNSTQFLRSDTADTMEAAFTLTSYLDQDYTGTAADALNINFNPASGSYDALDITYGSAGGTGTALKVTQSGTGDILQLYDGSTGVFFIKDGGNVGIGTTNPSFKLDVNGIVNATALYVNGSAYIGSQWTTSGDNIYYNSGNVGIGTTSPVGLLQVGTSPNAPLVVLAGGNVGIGTTTPGYKLQVAGDIDTSTGTIRMAGSDYGQYFIDSQGTSGQAWKSDGSGRGGWGVDNNSGGTVTSVTGTSPVASSGGTAPDISMAAATASVNGYMTSTYASKLDGITAGANLYVHPNHSGDVTSVADGAQTIVANAVTNAKMATMLTKTYKGNTTAGTAVPTDVAVATLKTDLVLVKADVGLGSVDNTADTAKPVSTAQQTALDLKADLASPTFTGTPAAPTAAAATNTTQLATTAFATTADNLKANLASPTFTGSVTMPGTGIWNSSGNVGIGTTSPAHKLDVSGAMYSRRYSLTDGATIAVDWNNGNVQSVTIAGNRTFTFSNGQDGGKYTLIIKQDTTGSRTITWPSTVRWIGSAPTLTTTASKTDYVGFIYNGVDSKYDGIAWRLNF